MARRLPFWSAVRARVSGPFAVVLAALLAAEPAGAAPPAPSVPARAYRTATGTLLAYDAAARLLTVRSAGASVAFRVASDARFWVGSHRLPTSQLRAHAGSEVTVAWSEVDGVPTTHTVRAVPAPAAHAR